MPNCPRCTHALTGPIQDHLTVCPNCGKRCQLDDSDTALQTTRLDVHSTAHGHSVIVPGTSPQGDSHG